MPKLYSSDDGGNMAGTHVKNRGWEYHKPDPAIEKLPKIASKPIDLFQGSWYNRMVPPRYAASALGATTLTIGWLFMHKFKVEDQPNVQRAYLIKRSAGYIGDELTDRTWPKGFTNPREQWAKNNPTK
eukprot:Rhum_TRINITY_DN3150_c0_g1::Rhum_TRINITY_DN3150_c0_g1_i1::g.9784::m.9784